ncbi:hypothetical protein F2Q69_00038008 [Brassica cretica]|uniref:Transmembrane protein n=1 Tax=Brassica cretica TaxID=69181 RepID=A0A8S9SSZ5_BRACR|nr:hypothetical protein F2Q69_00038008 [Brassica cretica]
MVQPVFIAARISCSSHFCHVCHLGLDSVFLRVCSVGLEGCLCIKLELWFFGGWLLFSLPQSFVVLRWHERLALVYGASYLLDGGWAFGALGMCLPTSLSTALRFANFILFSIPSLFSHLVAVFIAARISSSSHFCHVCHLGLDSVFLCVCSVGLEGCLCIKLELWFFGGWLPFSLSQSFVVLRWHERLALVYGASYLLAGGRAFGALGMCLPTSC